MTSLDWNSFVMEKNVSVASVALRAVPCGVTDVRLVKVTCVRMGVVMVKMTCVRVGVVSEGLPDWECRGSWWGCEYTCEHWWHCHWKLEPVEGEIKMSSVLCRQFVLTSWSTALFSVLWKGPPRPPAGREQEMRQRQNGGQSLAWIRKQLSA